MDTSTRHICCKCGRKRHITHLVRNNRVYDFKYKFKLNWKSYPQINSYLCRKDCLPYKS